MIDGCHHFDEVMTDFSMSAFVCKTGGYMVLDDMWMPAIRKAVSFIEMNRTDFIEITAVSNVAAFQKVASDKRSWDHFKDFR